MSSGTILDEIVRRTRADLAERMQAASADDIAELAAQHEPRGFAKALREAALQRPAVIAELKRASPSRGLVRDPFPVEELARSLERGGAACLSVLTDEPYFQGSLDNLWRASQSVGLPCLRKDFIVDAYQVLEARAFGADAILLIAAALNDAELRELREVAAACGLDVLCEVHDRAELDRVLELGCEMIGVNTRDLRSFRVDRKAAEELAAHIPADVVRVAESGIQLPSDLAELASMGYSAFLIGETLMRAHDPGTELHTLLGGAATAVPACG